MIQIDGSYGEGGGQIIRTALALACITSNAVDIRNIRAKRSQPGLRAQHVASVKAAAEICDADVQGDFVGSEKLVFRPGRAVRPGEYHFQIGTAGATALVLQTVLLPLALAEGASVVTIEGGTHVPFSPSAHYLRDVFFPMLIQSGLEAYLYLNAMGWYPQGGGEIQAHLEGSSKLLGQNLTERGTLERIFGVGVVTNLPAHIAQRLVDRTERILSDIGVPLDLRPTLTRGRSTGAGLFLLAEYENGRGGFTALGEKGVPSEAVADTAALALLEFHATTASVDEHLADQLLLPFALAHGESRYTTPIVTEHLETNKWVIQKFIERDIQIDRQTGLVQVAG